MVSDILKQRIKKIGDHPARQDGASVLYLMSRDQRVNDNAALYAAQQHAFSLRLPLTVGFVLYPHVQHAAKEHYAFMIEGLEDVRSALETTNIPFVARIPSGESNLQAAIRLVEETDPVAVYTDFNPLHGPRSFKRSLSERIDCPLYVVDTYNVVPVWVASDKQEVGARTLRPKIARQLNVFVEEPEWKIVKHPHLTDKTFTSASKQELLEAVAHAPSNGTQRLFIPGENAGQHALQSFIEERLRGYGDGRNNPTLNALSDLSPYRHYGQLATIRIVREVLNAAEADPSLKSDADTIIEEMVVRKELSENFCYYAADYRSFKSIPEWAKKTHDKHRHDPREMVYSLQQLEDAKTNDEAWNAAQRQLRRTGKMHGYMRMYWAKQVILWSETPEEALERLIYLNDFYHLDGRDPNGYVGILWSIGGLHDRPWGERPIFGTVRSMVQGGLKRKFDIDAFIHAQQ